MIFMNMLYHWAYLHIVPWAVPFTSYAIGGVWTGVIIAHKRLHVGTLSLHQQSTHFVLPVAYLAVLVSHYAMQVRP